MPDFIRDRNTVIMVGLSMERAEAARNRLLRHTLFQGIMFFVMGCAGMISLTIFQTLRNTRARLTSVQALSETLKKEVETTRHLAAIGKLAAGVAHEIRNPLSSIKGFATYFETRYPDVPTDRDTARIMVQEVERIDRAITQLLEFAKPMGVEKRTTDIRTLIDHSLKLVAHDLENRGITAQVDIQTDKETVHTDPDRINQILLNLYMNSLAAMNRGGTLSVSVTDAPEEPAIDFRVTDDGCGMDSALLADIFDPYFTTRPDGTGLGLSIVHRLVEALGGTIQVDSAPGRGTTFTIRLPEQAHEEDTQ